MLHERIPRMASRSTTEAAPEPISLHAWRLRILNGFLIALVPISIITVAVDIGSFIWEGVLEERRSIVLLEALGIFSVVLVAWLRWLPYALRAGLLVVMLFVIGMHELLQFGINSDGRLFFLIAIVFGVVFFGGRLGWSVFALVAGAMVLRLLALGPGLRDPSFSSALSDIVITMLVAAIGAIPLALLIKGMSVSTHDAMQLAQQAEDARVTAEEQAAALATSNNALTEAEQRLRDLVATLETPAVPLANGVLLAPLVGTIDSRRAQALTERLLTAAQQQHAAIVVIDVAGVAAVDAQVAQMFVQTTHALRLLGCEVVLTGVRPEMATMLTSLGSDLSMLRTASSPQAVLSMRSVRHTDQNHLSRP
jgi:anti-anti-sigma regulatory factor